MEHLAPHERQIVAVIAAGFFDYKSIAAKLNLSIRTVEHYVSSIAGKLQIEGRPRSAHIFQHVQNTGISPYQPTGRSAMLSSNTHLLTEALSMFSLGQTVMHNGVEWIIAEAGSDAEGHVGLTIHHAFITDEQLEDPTFEIPTAFIRDLSSLEVIAA